MASFREAFERLAKLEARLNDVGQWVKSERMRIDEMEEDSDYRYRTERGDSAFGEYKEDGGDGEVAQTREVAYRDAKQRLCEQGPAQIAMTSCCAAGTSSL